MTAIFSAGYRRPSPSIAPTLPMLLVRSPLCSRRQLPPLQPCRHHRLLLSHRRTAMSASHGSLSPPRALPPRHPPILRPGLVLLCHHHPRRRLTSSSPLPLPPPPRGSVRGRKPLAATPLSGKRRRRRLPRRQQRGCGRSVASASTTSAAEPLPLSSPHQRSSPPVGCLAASPDEDGK